MSGAYRLGQQGVVRMTGFPVEIIQELASPAWATAVDAVLALEDRLADFDRAVLDAASSDLQLLRSTRRALAKRQAPELLSGPPELLRAWRSRQDFLGTIEESTAQLEPLRLTELERIRGALFRHATSDVFHHVLLLSSRGLEERTPSGGSLPPRNKNQRNREQTWLSYLQRLTTKNETISFFGPSFWFQFRPGDPAAANFVLKEELRPRRIFLERWLCVDLASAAAAEPEVRPSLRPRWPIDLRLDDVEATLMRSGVSRPLSPAERELLGACDGRTSRATLGQDEAVDKLVAEGLLREDIPLPLTKEPLVALRREVERWEDGPGRDRWRAALGRIEEARAGLESATELEPRRAAMAALSGAITEVGARDARTDQVLYAGRVAFNEDCHQVTSAATLGQPVIDRLIDDLVPWYALWRDIAGLYATRLRESLVAVHATFGGRPVTLVEIIAAAHRQGVPLDKNGGTGFPRSLESEIQSAWQEEMGERLKADEQVLTAHDLGFLRRRFHFTPMKAFDWPAPDVQIIAESNEAIARGEWTMLLGEIHPDFTLWYFHNCPDQAAFVGDYRHEGHPPAIVTGKNFLFDDSVHVSVDAPQQVEGGWTFAGESFVEGQRSVHPTEVLVTVEGDDVVARDSAGEFLGSLVHNWNIAANTHQLELLGTGDHVPRLKVGRVVVQRRSWRIVPSEAERQELLEREGAGQTAFRRLRRQHDMPEEVFIRARLPVRQTTHKDGKPQLIDFQNPISLEILAGMLRQYREIRVTEMLPTTRQCWLRRGEGTYSCEFRLLTLPPERSASQ